MSARILVIEDNPTNLELMIYLLTAFGHLALTARDGEEGLDVAQRENPDLIICDIDIPKLNGYQVAEALKTHLTISAIPLIAVTAFAMVGDKDRVLAAGFDGYISKPIEPETFVPQVENFLPGKRTSPPKVYAATSTAEVRELPQQHTTMLAVDNLPANLLLIESILKPLGYNIIAARTMSEGIDLAQRHTPDVIVSDVHMPGGNGYDFIKAIKSEPRLSHIPFIFLSSTVWSEQAMQYGLSLGANRFLFRPIEPEVFLSEVEACLRGE